MRYAAMTLLPALLSGCLDAITPTDSVFCGGALAASRDDLSSAVVAEGASDLVIITSAAVIEGHDAACNKNQG